MVSSCIQNIVTIIKKAIQNGNNFVNLCSILNLILGCLELRLEKNCFTSSGELKTEKLSSTYRI